MDATMRGHARAVDALLPRLERVTDRGGGQYTALCPAHDDRNPSLSVKDADDRVLVKCWTGCSVGEVLAAVGLTLSDLFDRPLAHRHRPLSPQRRHDPRMLLLLVNNEALKVALYAHDMAQGKTLTAEDKEVLHRAYRRISRAVEAVT